MIYQIENSMQGDAIEIMRPKTTSFPPHMHNSFEFVAVTSGKMSITIEDSKKYELSSGEALLIFPNQLHEFVGDGSGEYLCVIFSPSFVEAYSAVFSSSVPVDNRISSPGYHIGKMSEILESEGSKKRLFLKAAFYSLCADFDENAEYEPKKSKDHSLIAKIFEFVEENYKGDCSLSALATHSGYHYVYLSRCFKECVGISFVEYVLAYRINEAKRLLLETNLSVLNIAYESGFNSLRSFNRAFKQQSGITPTEYRHPK